MKKTLLMMGLCATIFLTGCGNEGVSQEQYESVVAERDMYKAELDALKMSQVQSDAIADESESEIQTIESEVPEIAESETQEIVTSEKQEVILLDSGWTCEKPSKYTTIYYAVKMQNPNANYAIEYPKVIITVRDSEGKILKNDEQTLSSIAAGDTIIYGNDVSYEGVEPASVEISVSNRENNCEPQDDSRYVKQSDFVISNISENVGTRKKYTGEITNNSSVDFDSVSISIIYKLNGKMIGGENGYAHDVGAGETTAFEISSYSDIEEYDSFEIYAIQW